MRPRSGQLVRARESGVDGDFRGNRLPPFPVDDQTLDMLWAAVNPDPEVHDRSSLSDFLDLMSQLGGSDPQAVETVVDNGVERPGIVALRDQLYSHHDVISALIEEIRRLRAAMNGPRRP